MSSKNSSMDLQFMRSVFFVDCLILFVLFIMSTEERTGVEQK